MAAGPFDEATHKFMHGTGLPSYLVQLQRRYSQDFKSPNTSQSDSSLTCMWMIVHAACMFMHPSKSWPSRSLSLTFDGMKLWDGHLLAFWSSPSHRLHLLCQPWVVRERMATFTPFTDWRSNVGICWLFPTPTSSGQCRVEVDFGGNPRFCQLSSLTLLPVGALSRKVPPSNRCLFYAQI